MTPQQLEKLQTELKQFGSELQTTMIESFKDVDDFVRNDLIKREPIVPGVLFGVPLLISMLFHLIEQGNFMIIQLDVLFYGVVAAVLSMACREAEFDKKAIVSLVTLNLCRMIAPISALKLIILSFIPWSIQVILEELKQDLLKNDKKEDEKKMEESKKVEEKKPEEPKKVEEPIIAPVVEPLQEPIEDESPPIPTPPVIEEVEVIKPTKKNITKKYIEERKHLTVNLRQTLDLKGDRAYKYIITRFRKHALGRFFDRDYHFTKDDNDPLIVKNKEALLAHENTHQIWTHLYSTEFSFVFPEDIMPKGRDIKWEIDTFLLYSALCKILNFENETEVIFRYYNTLGNTNEDNVVVHRGHEGVKVVILPGENQPYLVRYLMKIEYHFNTKQNQYVDHITCKGLVDFKLTPYVSLKQVSMCLETAPSSPIVSNPGSRASLSPTILTTPQLSTAATPKRPSSALGSSQSDRQDNITAAFVDSSLKK